MEPVVWRDRSLDRANEALWSRQVRGGETVALAVALHAEVTEMLASSGQAKAPVKVDQVVMGGAAVGVAPGCNRRALEKGRRGRRFFLS